MNHGATWTTVALGFLALASVPACFGDGSGDDTPTVTSGDQCRTNGLMADADDGCNTCICQRGGWVCHRAACGDAGSDCVEGEVRVSADDCNLCTCSDGEWACTEEGCGSGSGQTPPGDPTEPPDITDPPEPAAMDTTCTPGEAQPSEDGCNSCTCTDANTWACTRRACPETCTDGDSRPAEDGCNTCSCSDGAWSCTEIACQPDVFFCGGFLGDTCGDDEYCAYEEGQYCGAADASAACKPRPNGCDDNYDPVCGCDGNTYSNACQAAGSGTGVLSSGECRTP